MVFDTVLLIVGLIAFSADPGLVAGDTFRLSATGVQVHVVERVIQLPGGDYPPPSGETCAGAARGLSKAAFSFCTVICVATEIDGQAYFFDVALALVGGTLFADSFEAGFSAWSSVTGAPVDPQPIFVDGFETGDTARWF